MHLSYFKCIITNMKCLVVFATVVAMTLASPINSQFLKSLVGSNSGSGSPHRTRTAASTDDQSAEIVKSLSDISPDGGYQWSYETSNGIGADEQGHLTGNAQEPSIQAQGSYHYTSPDGTPIQVTYVADENGFQPSGAHLPVPPPIPEAILRSLAYIEKHPEKQQTTLTGPRKVFY